MGTVITRDHTFMYDGRRYRLIYGGRGWGWEIVTDDFDPVQDGFRTLRDVRAHVDEARRNDWPLVPDDPSRPF